MRLIPEDVTKFFTEVITKTVKYRESHNYSRNDFLQTLIDIKHNKSNQISEETGKKQTNFSNQEFPKLWQSNERIKFELGKSLFEKTMDSNDLKN